MPSLAARIWVALSPPEAGQIAVRSRPPGADAASGRATIRPCHPPDGRSAPDPRPLFQPPPERQPLAARMRPRDLEEFVGQEHLVGERGPLRRSVARGHLSSLLLWGPPGTGKTSLARLLADAIGAALRRRCRRSCPASPRSARRSPRRRSGSTCTAPRTRPVPRRDPSLQQGPAGRAAAPRRGRHGHAHRRDDREPVLRGQRGAPVADARLAPRAADRRRGRHRRPPGARRRGARPGRTARPDGRRRPDRRRVRPPRLARRRRRARGAQRPRGRDRAGRVRGRSATPTATSARDSRTSRPPPSSASSPTTAPATATTTRSRRSSRACAATTRTPRCTGWRR